MDMGADHWPVGRSSEQWTGEFSPDSFETLSDFYRAIANSPEEEINGYAKADLLEKIARFAFLSSLPMMRMISRRNNLRDTVIALRGKEELAISQDHGRYGDPQNLSSLDEDWFENQLEICTDFPALLQFLQYNRSQNRPSVDDEIDAIHNLWTRSFHEKQVFLDDADVAVLPTAVRNRALQLLQELGVEVLSRKGEANPEPVEPARAAPERVPWGIEGLSRVKFFGGGSNQRDRD